MALSASERGGSTRRNIKAADRRVQSGIERIYAQAHHVMGEHPDLAADEILNFSNHNSRALEACDPRGLQADTSAKGFGTFVWNIY